MRKNRWIYSAIIVAAISFLTIGYSAFTNNLNIDTILAYFRAEADIRITNISLDKFENNAISQYEEYGVDGISSEITLPAANSTITYKIDVTNFGGVKMVLSKINGLPDNLMYTIDNYELDHIICDDDNKCMLGITKPLLLTIKYKDAGYNVEDTTYNLNLNFDFSECKYKIKYHNLFIPKEYQEVEYIESTGTQRLNTKYIPKTNTKMELVLSFSGDFDISSGTVGTGTFFSSSSDGNVFSVNFGSAASQGNNLFTWFDKNQANGGAIHYYDTNNSIRTNKNTMTYEKGIFKYGSSNAKEVAVKSENQTTPMYLFGSATKNFDRYNMKVYRLKFSEDGVLKRDYIPCYRKSDGVVGLYELLTGTFHPNIGTGEFNKGNDVTNSQVEADYTTVQTVSYDETSSIKSPELVRNDYNLTGWTTNKDGSGTKYEVGQNFTNLCITNNCEINLYAQWKTYVGEEIYYVMNSIATPDNIQSQYVSSPNGIDFTKSSGITNGRGLYVMADTINSPHPIYYYRGKVNDNNAVFGKFCWKILRTTDTGGIRLLIILVLQQKLYQGKHITQQTLVLQVLDIAIQIKVV